jgi:hypothetical protein
MFYFFLLKQCIINVQHRTAGIAEYVFNPLFLQTSNSDFRTRQLHHQHPKFKRNKTMQDKAYRRFGQLLLDKPRSLK